MLTLYYSKGSSAVAAHILLTEVGADFEAVEVSIPKGEHRTPEFLARFPKGRIPVLDTPDGVLTENPAILEYIAATHPDANVLPQGAFAQAEARALSAYLCATVHVAFAHKQRGARWADTDSAIETMKAKVAQNLRECAAYLQDHLHHPWAMGAQYTYCDAYLFLMNHWLKAGDIEIKDYPKLAAHRDAMRARAATQQVMAIHGLA